MADWIKMRSSLLTNPKVIRMARVLLAEREFLDWLCPGCDVPVTRDEAVTKRHVPVVTRIVVGALLPTWSAVNDTAARDGIIRYAASRDIDETAGVPCFGNALLAVEWLIELPGGQGVQFVNFEEHNSPQKERTLTAKTGAERAKEYRERKKAGGEASLHRNGERDDKSVTPSRDASRDSSRLNREEERREEDSSSLRSEEGRKRRTPRSKQTKTLAAYLEACRSEHRKPLPADHAIRQWARDAGISDEMLQVAWVVFRRQYTEDPNYRAKEQKDWPAHFANSVRKRWAELWYVDKATGDVQWTSTGLTEKASLDAKAKAREQEPEHA